MNTILKSFLLLGFVLIQGCASEPKTLSQVYDRYEEDNYTNWVKDQAYFDKMEADYQGSLASHLILSFDLYGEPLNREYVEDTLGWKLHEKAFLASTLFGSFSKLDLASLLVINNDGPTFGSNEYTTQFVYRRNVDNMSMNTHFFASSFAIDNLDTFANTEPKSYHHKLHLITKRIFLSGLNDSISELRKQEVDCLPLGYNQKRDGSNFAKSRVFVNPLSQYEAAYDCRIKDKKHILIMTTVVVKDTSNKYRIVSSMSLSGLKDLNRVDPYPLLDLDVWQGTMSTCRTCDSNYDRIVKIASKKQDKTWVERFEKGTLYN
ncbi:exported hypothetical protein [Vibrio nigripulchritudo FTn2]|uniref:hypothetical protein n=1 Tax=Vibrio nigripulchritudo TaxID=28173 RepID=UPI0003B192CD|nr:hypothetical protein [Vibrio nigripulchritudo]CCN40028.1 exported hypothetical protein [Vibrio nigripulchritudo FTn2]